MRWVGAGEGSGEVVVASAARKAGVRSIRGVGGLRSGTEVDEKNGGHLWASPRSQRFYCHIFLVILKIMEWERVIAEGWNCAVSGNGAMGRYWGWRDRGGIFSCNSGISLVLGEGIGNKAPPSGRNWSVSVGEAGKRLQIETNSQQMLIFISDLSENASHSDSSSFLHCHKVEWIIKQIWGSITSWERLSSAFCRVRRHAIRPLWWRRNICSQQQVGQ